MKRLLIYLLPVLLSLLVFVLPALADIYSWTDENGVAHYSNREPVGQYNDLRVITSISHDPSADEARWEMDQKEWDALQREIESEDRQRKADAQKKRLEKEKAKPPTREEKIAAEKARLENKIAELTAMPLSAFGSQKNKRRRLAVYHYKLDELKENPDAYFDKAKTSAD